MKNISPLEELNNDCLDHLFEFLELDDVVKLNSVSRRFRESAQRWMRRRMANEEFMELGELAHSYHVDPGDFLAVFGNCIKRIRVLIPSDDIKYLNALPECCENLDSLGVEIREVTTNIDMTFLGRMRSIRGLVVEGMVDIDVVEEIIKLHNLERLRIESDLFTGSQLNGLQNLRELNLLFCEQVQPRSLFNICPRLEKVAFGPCYADLRQDTLLDFFRLRKNLVYADVQNRNCYSVSLYKAIVDIRKMLRTVRTLKLTIYRGSNYYYEMMSYMKSEDYAALKKFVEIEDKY